MTAIPPDPSAPPLRKPAPDLLDQRQQQIDPAGHHRRDPQNPPGRGQAPAARPERDPERDLGRDLGPKVRRP